MHRRGRYLRSAFCVLRSAFCLALIAFLSAAPNARAQTPDEDSYTFHVYVDPIYGDDVLASLLNPTARSAGPVSRRFLAAYPANFPEPTVQGTGYVQHAPYSFRTLGGPSGAMAYLSLILPGSPGAIAWENSETLKRVDWVVVHCLPGLYGPVEPPLLPEHDTVRPDGLPGSELRYNGDQFPISLREGIGIQGTSALDTVFDARETETAIFIGALGLGLRPTFVDSLTVRGARSNGLPPQTASFPNRTGAAFAIGPGQGADQRLVISNCFIVQNDVGIALMDDPREVRTNFETIRPVIVNNTIAWNRIGIWSGNPHPDGMNPLAEMVGVVQPLLLNNIIDPGEQDQPLGISIIGLHPWDLGVLLGGPGSTTMTSFNAYPTGSANQVPTGFGQISNFPTMNAGIRQPFPVGPPSLPPVVYPLPRVDIGPYMPTPTPTKPRGVLYINDAFRQVDPLISRHDFRLAPQTIDDPRGVSAQNPMTEVNPLVNMGLATGTGAGLTSITFANHSQYWDFQGWVPGAALPTPAPTNNRLSEPSAFAAPDIESAPGHSIINSATPDEPDLFHAWDWDCEGYGNPRVRCRTGFPVSTTSPGQLIDLGADEMDPLIISGYTENTRMLRDSKTGLSLPSRQFFFFDLFGGSPYPRPAINVELGIGFDWWDHSDPAVASDDVSVLIGTVPGTPYAGNYTDGDLTASGNQAVGLAFNPPYFRNLLVKTNNPGLFMPPLLIQAGQPVFLRNLACDFSPSLVNDLHPRWGDTWFQPIPVQDPVTMTVTPDHGDPYASNPWFGAPAFGLSTYPVPPLQTSTVPVDNWTLYRNPQSIPWRGGVLAGSISPPLTFQVGTMTDECGSLASGFLTTSPGGSTLGQWSCAATAPSPTQYSIGPFGFHEIACPATFDRDELLFLGGIFNWWGIRFNCQVYDPFPRSNLQTFLAVLGESASLPAMASATQSRESDPVELQRMLDSLPMRDEVREQLRRLVEGGQR